MWRIAPAQVWELLAISGPAIVTTPNATKSMMQPGGNLETLHG